MPMPNPPVVTSAKNPNMYMYPHFHNIISLAPSTLDVLQKTISNAANHVRRKSNTNMCKIYDE